MGKNTQRLGGILASRMNSTARAVSGVPLELGTINGDMSLKVDSLNGNISPNEYLVVLHLTHENYFTYNELNSSSKAPHVHAGGTHSQEIGSGYHTHSSDGLHDHRLPSVFRGLKPGDRVLVAWAGVEPVIVEIVVEGTTITKN